MADYNNINNQGSFENYDLGGSYGQDYYYQEANAPSISLSTYTAKTFLWMFLGLMVTFAISAGLVYSGAVYNLITGVGTVALIVVLIAQLAVVGVLSGLVRKLSVGGARALFLVYAALNGVAFSIYFIYFNMSVLVLAFGATALLFGGMAAASLIFKMQLDSIRPILFGGLIMMILFGILSFFLNLGALNTVLCYVGIALFMGYTAYDTSKIKENYYYYSGIGDNAMLEKASVFSALQLYLDFVNLLLYIIRLFSRSSGSSSRN